MQFTCWLILLSDVHTHVAHTLRNALYVRASWTDANEAKIWQEEMALKLMSMKTVLPGNRDELS